MRVSCVYVRVFTRVRPCGRCHGKCAFNNRAVCVFTGSLACAQNEGSIPERRIDQRWRHGSHVHVQVRVWRHDLSDRIEPFHIPSQHPPLPSVSRPSLCQIYPVREPTAAISSAADLISKFLRPSPAALLPGAVTGTGWWQVC